MYITHAYSKKYCLYKMINIVFICYVILYKKGNCNNYYWYNSISLNIIHLSLKYFYKKNNFVYSCMPWYLGYWTSLEAINNTI